MGLDIEFQRPAKGLEFIPDVGLHNATLKSIEVVDQKNWEDEGTHKAIRFVYTLHLPEGDQDLWRTTNLVISDSPKMSNLFKDCRALLGEEFLLIKNDNGALCSALEALEGKEVMVQVGRTANDKPKIESVFLDKKKA